MSFSQKEGGRQFVLETINAFNVKIIKLKLRPLVVSTRTEEDMPPHYRRIPGLLDVQSRNVPVLSLAYYSCLGL